MNIFILILLLINDIVKSHRTKGCECGVEKVSGRIVNGDIVTQFTKRWVVFIRNNTENKEQYCGGNIVSDRHILTASHCVKDIKNPADIQVVALTLNKSDVKPENVYNVAKITMNPRFHTKKIPEFDPTTIWYYDAAILEVERHFDLNVLTPVCLPKCQLMNYTQQMLAMGWGVIDNNETPSNELREVWVKQTDFDDCNKHWKCLLKQKVHLCAAEYMKDTCNEDSGGPLMIKSHGKWVVVGLTSFGEKCAINLFAVYTRVSYFVPWILREIRKGNGVMCSL